MEKSELEKLCEEMLFGVTVAKQSNPNYASDLELPLARIRLQIENLRMMRNQPK